MLLTGFEPFAGAAINPSWDAVEMLAATWRGGVSVTVRRLPVEFGRASALLLEWIEADAPDIVIAVGVAEGRSGVTPEQLAVNLDDAAIPDNAGKQPVEVETVPGADAVSWSTLPVREMVTAIRARGLPASVSRIPGSFVCNHVFYALQHALGGRDVLSGFIHVPASPEMNLGPDVPTMTVPDIAAALTIALEVTLAEFVHR